MAAMTTNPAPRTPMTETQHPSDDDAWAIRLQQFELAEQLGNIGHWSWTVGEPVVEWSPQTYRIHGVTPQTFTPTLEAALEAYVPDERQRVADFLTNAIENRTGFDFESRIRRPDGTERAVRSIGEFTSDKDGPIINLFGVFQDVTDERTAQRAIAEAQQRQQDFAEVASDWLWEMGPDLKFIYVSERVEAQIGVSPSYFIGKSRRELAEKAEQTPEMEEHLKSLERHEPHRDFRYWVTGPTGERHFTSQSGKPIFDETGAFAGYRGSGRNVTEEHSAQEELLASHRKLVDANVETRRAISRLKDANALTRQRYAELVVAQARIRHTAMHDHLTGIANRSFLDDQLATFARRCASLGEHLAVMHLDLDRFKQINDTMGHAAGDAVLKHTAKTLTDLAEEHDFVARVGGDEFVILRSCDGGRASLSAFAEKIIDHLSKPIKFEERQCWFGASVGIAVQPPDEVDAETLLVNADIALYRAKNEGRNRFEFFTTELQATIVAYKRTADGILSGLNKSEFFPLYQPQFDAQTFDVAGVEALARWRHPKEGTVGPGAFLPVAEDLAVVDDIDHMILEKAIADSALWHDDGIIVPKVSVNVSARRLMDTSLVDQLTSMDSPKTILSFELLESIFLDDVDDSIIWTVDMLREMGIQIELDDFGSGHASIISLIKIAPDTIKIDRELIAPIAEDESRRSLVKSIVGIGKSLDVRVVAEGVETLDQALLLRAMGCDVLQGFYFAKPMSAERLADFVGDWSSRKDLQMA
jgi:diguanylate cyclase (GGDEF)-like protein/PAS domain S-box-containing protein